MSSDPEDTIFEGRSHAGWVGLEYTAKKKQKGVGAELFQFLIWPNIIF